MTSAIKHGARITIAVPCVIHLHQSFFEPRGFDDVINFLGGEQKGLGSCSNECPDCPETDSGDEFEPLHQFRLSTN